MIRIRVFLVMVLVTAGLATSVDPALANHLTCRGLQTNVDGSSGADILVGTGGADVIQGLGGNDVVLANGGADLVCGGGGHDTIRGHNGNDDLYGNSGDDKFYDYPGEDYIQGDPGYDQLFQCPDGQTDYVDYITTERVWAANPDYC